MRGCDTAIVQVDADALPCEAEPRIPADVLIEIGAAMALYGRNFVLLVEDQVGAAAEPPGALRMPLSRRRAHMPAMMELLRAFSPNPAQKAHGRDSAT
jgi:hypothetical protein